jgi:DNA-binding GntR family transcriptional regulator
MSRGLRHCAAIGAEELAELRLLIELPALRRLAHRGLSGQELALVSTLADATTGAARGGDVPGYRHADMVFHLCLLDLAGDPALSDIARILRGADRVRPPSAAASGSHMARGAREHRELVGLLADGMATAADDLLRLHFSRRSGGWPGVPPRAGDPVGIAGA